MIEKKVSCFECLNKSQLFKTLSEEELNIINQNRHEVSYAKGEIIFKQNTPITHIISITSGIVKVYLEGFNNKKFLLQFIKPTEFLGGPGAFVDNIHHFSASAVEDTTACFIDKNIFMQMLRRNPDFAEAYIIDISKKGIYNFNRFLSLSQKQMHGRVADALLYFQNEIYFKCQEGFIVSNQDMADYSGLSKDSVSRIIKQFETEEIIKVSKGGCLRVLDEHRLMQISQVG